MNWNHNQKAYNPYVLFTFAHKHTHNTLHTNTDTEPALLFLYSGSFAREKITVGPYYYIFFCLVWESDLGNYGQLLNYMTEVKEFDDTQLTVQDRAELWRKQKRSIYTC